MLAFLSDFCTIMTLLLLSVSSRQRGTLADLIIGAACSMSGHVTSCVEATCAEKHITAYYNLINRGNIDTESLFSAIVKCFINACSRLKLEHVCLIIDDTIQPRSSEKAPCVQKLTQIRDGGGALPWWPRGCRDDEKMHLDSKKYIF
jgi:hypothetical protein